MNKVSNVSFKGLNNVGCAGVTTQKGGVLRIVAQLTDEVTPDLNKFADVFEKFPDPLNKGFLRIDNEFTKDNGKTIVGQFKINGKFFHLGYDNFPMVAKVLGLIDTINSRAYEAMNTGKREFIPIERAYVEGKDCIKNYTFDKIPRTQPQIDQTIREAHSPTKIIASTEIFSKFLTESFRKHLKQNV